MYTNIMDEGVIKSIEENAKTESTSTQQENAGSTWLIFYSGEKPYAIAANLVREILRNDEIFPIPFVPPYIKGVINYYGKPYSVVDFSQFTDEAESSSRLFLIINDENDVALQISDIQEFQTLQEDALQEFSDKTDAHYFSGAVRYDNGVISTIVPVLNIKGIFSRIKQDFENS